MITRSQHLISVFRGLATCCVLLLGAIVHAEEISDIYTGGTSNLLDPSMWSSGMVPGEEDRGLVNLTYEVGDYAYLDQAHAMQNLTLGAGFGDVGVLQIRSGGALSLLGAEGGVDRVMYFGFEGEGHLELQAGGSFELVDGDVQVGSQSGSVGSVEHAAGASFTTGGALMLGTFASAQGTYTLAGGDLTVGGFMLVGREGTGTMVQTGGDVAVNRGTPEEPANDPGLYIGSNPNSTGHYTISGGTLSVSADNGGFRIGRPTNDTTATFRIEGASPTITVGTTLEHNLGAQLEYAADLSGVSSIDVAGDVRLAGNLSLSFPGALSVGDEFTLINYDGSLTGKFAGIDTFTTFQGTPFVVSYGSGSDSAVVAAVVPAVMLMGDFDDSGTITATDYDIFLANLNTGVLESGVYGNYLLGDMNFDTVVDYADAQLFRQAFDAMNGAGAFMAMIGATQVPEPATWTMVALAGACLAVRRKWRWRVRPSRKFACLVALLALGASTAQAQITYVDAVRDVNATMLDGTSVPVGSSTTDGLWNYRTGLGIDGNVWESFYSENVAPLKVTTPVVNTAFGYNVYVFFWTNASQNWRIEGTVNLSDINDNGTPDNVADDFLPAEAPFSYNAKGAADGTLTGTQALAGEAPILVDGTDRTLYRGYIGTTFAGEDGTLTAYIDNYQSPTATNGRNFFDGIGYEVGAVNLTLEVDAATGAASIVNNSGTALAIDYYEIRSTAGAMDDQGWLSLDQQLVGAIDGNDPDSNLGNSSTERWGVAGGSMGNVNMLSEFYLPGYMTIANGQSLDLGTPFDFSEASTEGITFSVGVEGYGLLPAVVEITPSALENADFNGDGIVDAADYTVWRNNLGANGVDAAGDANNDGAVDSLDYLVWKSQFGTNPGGSLLVGSPQGVPEPSTWLLAIGSLLLAVVGRRQHAILQPAKR